MSAPSPDLLWSSATASAVAVGIPIAVLASSFLGSIHCAAMCGPIVMSLGANRMRMMAYNIGRLLAYGVLGALAGATGKGALADLQQWHWLSAMSLVSMGGLLIWLGLRSFLNKPAHVSLVPGGLVRLRTFFWTTIQSLPRPLAIFATGAFSIFLPCSHLYGFALGAAATGAPVKGALFMLVFWLGTLPALALGPFALRRLIGATTAHSARLAGALLMVAGLASIGAFAANLIDHAKRPAEVSSAPRCH